jgi:hypothetical protein
MSPKAITFAFGGFRLTPKASKSIAGGIATGTDVKNDSDPVRVEDHL